MREREDVYGRPVLDHLEGRPAGEIIERDDGYYLIVSPDEMRALAEAGGWEVERFVDEGSELYAGILRKR